MALASRLPPSGRSYPRKQRQGLVYLSMKKRPRTAEALLEIGSGKAGGLHSKFWPQPQHIARAAVVPFNVDINGSKARLGSAKTSASLSSPIKNP